jgi:hypothetical protein
MAYEIPGFQFSLPAGADLSAHQYKFVKINSSGQCVLCAAVTDKPIGILQNDPPAAGVAANIMVNGISKLKAAANLAVGDQIGTDAAGLGAANVPGTDTTKYTVGEVIGDNTVANGVVSVLFNCAGAGRGA